MLLRMRSEKPPRAQLRHDIFAQSGCVAKGHIDHKLRDCWRGKETVASLAYNPDKTVVLRGRAQHQITVWREGAQAGSVT